MSIPHEIVERIGNKLARSFKFAHYTHEDIKQECWVYALEAYKKYDPKYNLYSYLYLCCYRKCLNLLRNNYRKTEAPCKECHKKYLSGKKIGFCDSYKNEKSGFCRKYNDWVKNNFAKQKVCVPAELGSFQPEDNRNPVKDAIFAESIELIWNNLDEDGQRIYTAWIDGEATKSDEEFLFNKISEILHGCEG